MTSLASPAAFAQVDCSDLTLTQCTQATGQYQLLQSFQALPDTAAGRNVLDADLASVVSIYQSATAAQRSQAVLNAQGTSYQSNGVANSYLPTPQYNLWQQISASSQILPTLGVYPQLPLSSALAGSLSAMLGSQAALFKGGMPTSSINNAITELLLGDGTAQTNSIAGVQQGGVLKNKFTAYAIYYPYSNPANTTAYSLPPCPNGGSPCQPDPRPYQLTTQISPWQPGQATASDIAGQASQWAQNQASGSFPSGHSIVGNTAALLYAMMLPQAYQSMMVSAEQFGLSRNILGVHHTFDIIGGRMLAYYTMTQLMADNPDYVLSGVPTFSGIPAYTDFPTYVAQVASILQADLGAANTAVPYASCASAMTACIAGGVFPTASQFAAANQAYATQATYGLPALGATNLAPVVPANAEVLLNRRFPYLSNAQIRDVLASTELPSGGALDDGTGWVRLNLFKAAGGYGAFSSNVSVTLDAAQGGFNAIDMWSNDISGPGGLTKNGSGVLVLGGANSYAGGTTVAGGTLALTGSMIGNLTIQSGATFVSGGGYKVAAGAQMSNAGTFQSVGSSLLNEGTINNSGALLGGLVNNGVFNQTGGAYANVGTLINNATFNGSVTNAGLIGGTGTFTGTLVNNGTLAPGNSIGTLTVAGTYIHNAGSTYQVETSATGASDRLNVTGAPGTATLNGGTVQVAAGPGIYAPSTTYTILNAGGVTGRFAGASTALPFLQASLAYDASNVFLTLQPGGFAAGAATANQAAVGGALDRSVAGATGDFATIVGTLATATPAQAQAAMNALGGQNYAGFSSANLGAGMLFMNAVGRQLDAARGGDPGTSARTALAEACDAASAQACGSGTWSAWATALAGFGSIAGTANAGTVTYGGGGAAVGLDYRLEARLLVGLGVGFVSSSQSTDGLAGRGTTSSYQAALYGSFTDGGLWIDALAGYGFNDNRMTRLIVIAGLQPRTAYGSTGANQLLGQVEAGYRFGLPLPAATIAPFARLQGTTVMQNGFSETGAQSLNLTVAGQTTNSLRSALGIELGGNLPTGRAGGIGLLLRLGWAHEFADTARPVTASFAGAPGSNFTVLGAQPSRDAAVLALAANKTVGDATSIYLRYDGEIGGGSDAHALTAGLRIAW